MIKNMRVVRVFKKYKRALLILMFLFGYVMFWSWFFSERNVAIEENSTEQKEISASEKEKVSKHNKKEKQFTEFGDFWIQINTDDVHIKAPIVEGVTDEKLAKGVGHHKTTAFPNREGGNVVLSGHRWRFGKDPAFKVFENIDKLKIGDRIIIHYGGKNFEYEVTEQETVNDKAVEILEQTEDPMLTFYACTPKYTALKRLVYRAKLINIQ